MQFGSDVFIKERRRLFEILEISKMLTCTGIEPRTIGMRSAGLGLLLEGVLGS